MTDLSWLTARPLAHRGLHDEPPGIIENTPTAFAAAIASNYGIETDLQVSADGEAMVHHDDVLGRLTEGTGALAEMTAAQLKAVPFRSTADRMITLGELCDLVAGRVTLLLELKSQREAHTRSDHRLASRIAAVLQGYRGPVAAMSFDPALMAAVRAADDKLVRGIVAEKSSHSARSGRLWHDMTRLAGYFAHVRRSGPQFLAYSGLDLPAFWPTLTRRIFHRPLLTWTVRTAFDRERARQFADQIIFEGFRP